MSAHPVQEDRRVPLYWHSNAPWAGTGYGTQTALFVPLISQLGYRCAIGAFYGLRGRRIPWTSPITGETFQVYPGGDDAHGNDVFGANVRHWFGPRAGGLVVALTDPWVIAAPVAQRLPLLAWTPVDHDPLIPQTNSWLKKTGAIPVAMSRWGEDILRNAGHETVYYVPHGYNPAIFKPADRRQAREALGLPLDAFLVGMVAANVGERKCFPQAVSAFGRFQRKHKDAILYLHTELQSPRGVDIPAICRANSVRAMSSDQYGLKLGPPDSLVSALMSAFDVLLNPSSGEGFGVPLVEAQACGTPCIVTDFSAMPEVAPESEGNWNVAGQDRWTGFGSNQLLPDIDAIEDALEKAYADTAEERQARRISVFNYVTAKYRAADVTEQYWKEALEFASIEFAWRDQMMMAVVG